jgi:hypothetical protein
VSLIEKAAAVLGRDGSAAILMGSIGLLLCGCEERRPVWSTEVRSPDEGWRAIAQTFSQSGPGTNRIDTIVTIERLGGFGSTSSQVLGVSDGGQALRLTMRWITPKHLVIVLNDDPNLVYYQVVKTSGLEVSLRNDYSPPKEAHY